MDTWQPLWVLYFVVLPLLSMAGLVLIIRSVKRRPNIFASGVFSMEAVERYVRIFLIALVLLALAVAAFKIVQNISADANWSQKQHNCALDAGYSSPADYTSGYTTDSSRQLYKECLAR
jgi:hypothetical protein